MNENIEHQTDDWFIHRHLAQNMDARLDWLKTSPKAILLAGCDFDESRELLAKRYPDGQFTEMDGQAAHLAISQKMRQSKKSLWQKLGKDKLQSFEQALDAPFASASFDMVWSNLGLFQAQEPTVLFERWSDVLRVDGMVFLSYFGPDTLQEVKALLHANGIAVKTPKVWDMHDLGDMLFHHGFYDPVMDMDRLSLSYQNGERFWQDLQLLPIWSLLDIAPEEQDAAKQLVDQAFANGQLSDITLELIFGHAIKKIMLPENEAMVQFYPSKPSI